MGKKKPLRILMILTKKNRRVITSFLINHLSNCNKLLCLTSINIQFFFNFFLHMRPFIYNPL